METYREHPRHCKLRRYGVELSGTVGKDDVRHQRRPTSRFEERRCEPLLDVILLRRFQTRMILPRSHVKRVSLVWSSCGLVCEGGHLSPCLPNCNLEWDLRLLHSLLPSGSVTLGVFCCCEPQSRTQVCPQEAQHLEIAQYRTPIEGMFHGMVDTHHPFISNTYSSVGHCVLGINHFHIHENHP